ncbi:murein biosynthesis integral membrane protein MurJ [Oricola cellulosilytica]|uniref:Probable lipid II flippase MurJ n=1 Tax=Oricola cellulosilytica TaxID=1429082 RepID=A0A4R0PIG9_9HYPH|nr:murein biosynthesis integral membrane protein MurJ [Oricola cellulosilytica]TCD16300.1 murein biosynthesis integral membrane protein MurJ [Oricola cellulosilytica]
MSLFVKFIGVGGATSASRVLGFVREATIAAVLGAGPVADAFYAALRFPNLFRRLFAEGAFNAAFVPIFAKEVEINGNQSAAKFAGEVFSILVLVLGILSVFALIFMPFLAGTVIAPAFQDTPEKFDLTVLLARIMFPYLAAMSLVAMLTGVLNSFRKYFLAALAPVLLNIVLISVLFAAIRFDLPDKDVGIALAVGVVFSGLLQLGLLVFGLVRAGFRFVPRPPRLTPQISRLLKLAAPAALTGGIVQINLVVGQIIASQQDGAIALLNYADRIYQLPLGVIGIAIGVVLLPELARALGANEQKTALSLQNRSLEFGLGLTLPAAVALALAPVPFVAVIYERGAFSHETTLATAHALAAFAIGLPSFVMIKVLQPGFFAREDMRTPMWFSLVSLVVNAAGSLLMFPVIGHVGIAAATSLAGWANALLLGVTLWHRDHFRPAPETLRRAGLTVVCSIVMGAFLYGAWIAIEDAFIASGILMRVLFAAGLVAACVAIYFGLAIATGAVDRSMLIRSLKRGGKASPAKET